MKKLLTFATICFATACIDPAPIPTNEVYSCLGVAVCDGYETTYPGDLCFADEGAAQDQVNSWVADCRAASIAAGCQTYDCTDTCDPTGDGC